MNEHHFKKIARHSVHKFRESTMHKYNDWIIQEIDGTYTKGYNKYRYLEYRTYFKQNVNYNNEKIDITNSYIFTRGEDTKIDAIVYVHVKSADIPNFHFNVQYSQNEFKKLCVNKNALVLSDNDFNKYLHIFYKK